MGAISNSISLYSLSICPRTPNFASHTLSTRRRILHTDVMPVRKIPLHERRCVFGVVALLCMSCLVDHCTRSLGHASMPHIILVSVRGGEMRTRREGASGRRISLALHVFGGLFPSTLADRIFWSSVLTLTTSQHSFMCALQPFVKSRRTLLHIITPPRHSHVSHFARTGCGSI